MPFKIINSCALANLKDLPKLYVHKHSWIMCNLSTPWPMYRPTFRPTLDWCIGQHIDRNSTAMSVNVSADPRPIYRPRYVGQHIDRHIGQVSVDQHSTDILVNMLIDISRSIYRSGVSQYVDWYIGQGVHKIHIIHTLYALQHKAF